MAASNTKFRVENGLDVIGQANVSGSLRVQGDLIVNGSVTQTGTSTGDFIPNQNDTYQLGNTSYRWILNASNGNFSSTLTSNNISASGTLAAGNTTVTGFLSISSYGTFGGTVNATALNIGANVVVTTSSITTGNSTVNTVISSSGVNTDGTLAVLGAATLSNTASIAGTLGAGNTTVTGFVNASSYGTFAGTVNATALNIGANVVVTTSSITTGNSTVNTVVSSSGIDTDGTLAVLSTATLSNTVTITGNTTANVFVPYTNSVSLGSSTRLWNLSANTADIVTATITSLTVTGNSTVVNVYSSGSIAPQSTSTFNALTGVANTTEYITTSSAHAFVNGDVVTYLVATGNTAVSGLSNNTTYYVVGANSTALQLASSLGGAALNLTAGVSQTGHSLTSQVILSHNRITATGATANVGVLNVIGGIANSNVNGNVVFDTDLLFLDATNNRIGFKNTSPSSADLITITGNTVLSTIGNAIRFLTSNASHNAAVYITGTTTNTRLVLSTYDNSTNSTSQDGGFLFNSVNATSTTALLSATKGSFQYKSGNVAHSGNFGVYDINGTRVGP